jgi:hypothetical protein
MATDIEKIAFKVDDLLINVLPTRNVKVGDTSLTPSEWFFSLAHMFCHGCTLIRCAKKEPPPEEIEKAFKVLKQELEKHLGKHPDAMMKDEGDILPSEPAEVAELQQKLRAALVALDERSGRKDG